MKNKFLKIQILIFVPLFFAGCSVKFDQAPVVEDVIPEFIFQNTKLSRYQDKKLSSEVEAENIEQYKNSNSTYAKGVNFKSYNENGETDSEGSCGYLFADTDKELYELFDGIEVNANSENTKFTADRLKWNSKSEQLTGDVNDTVYIQKDGTIISGTGFSASGVSKSFTFSGNVSGEIETDEE